MCSIGSFVLCSWLLLLSGLSFGLFCCLNSPCTSTSFHVARAGDQKTGGRLTYGAYGGRQKARRTRGRQGLEARPKWTEARQLWRTKETRRARSRQTQGGQSGFKVDARRTQPDGGEGLVERPKRTQGGRIGRKSVAASFFKRESPMVNCLEIYTRIDPKQSSSAKLFCDMEMLLYLYLLKFIF